MYPLRKLCGLTILELLFVLTIGAGIILFSLRSYVGYRDQLQLARVQHDVTTIESALNAYYNAVGFTAQGRFAGNMNPSITTDLGLSEQFTQFEPMVRQFSAVIIETDSTMHNGAPIYRLAVQARLSATLPQGRVQWLAKKLNAQHIIANDLVWSFYPGNTSSAMNKRYWILQGAQQLFNQQETIRSR